MGRCRILLNQLSSTKKETELFKYQSLYLCFSRKGEQDHKTDCSHLPAGSEDDQTRQLVPPSSPEFGRNEE